MTRSTGMLAVLTVTLVVGFLGWRKLDTVRVARIDVRGAVQADTLALIELSGVVSGGRLMEVSPAIAADRVVRHPWVESASVSRLPTGTVVISVKERRPVAMSLRADGTPDYYLDANGYRMPVGKPLPLPVPIMRGLREAYHPVPPTQSEAVRDFLSLLPELEDEQDALLSEIHETSDGGIDIFTAVSPAGQSIRVRMGRDRFGEKLDRLEAFWTQSVLHRPDTHYEWIDLRFERQVITRERA